MADVGSSDRNFYDRWYFNAHDRTGDIFVDLRRWATTPTSAPRTRSSWSAAATSRPPCTSATRWTTTGSTRTSAATGSRSPSPLEELRVVLEETEGIAMDLPGAGLFPAIQEAPHVMRTGTLRKVLDAQRFAQCGSWEGTIVDRRRGDRRDAATAGSARRDRSWGIRPVRRGRAARARRPTRPWGGMWWLYVPVAFDDFGDLPDHPGGGRRLPAPQRLHPDLQGRPDRAARLAADRHDVRLRHPDADERRRSRARCPTARPVTIELESLLPVPIHVGGGYGGDPDWGHGQWKGPDFTERRHLRHDRPGRRRPRSRSASPTASAGPSGTRRAGAAGGLGPLRARRPRPPRAHRLHRLVHPRPLTAQEHPMT